MKIRPTARLIVLDAQQRVLLFKLEETFGIEKTSPTLPRCWVTPGGGVEVGESFEQAAQRELWEETGYTETIGPCIWQLERVGTFMDQSVLFQERYFLVQVRHNEVSLDNLLEDEKETIRGYRWWRVAEIRQADEVIFPEGLADLLEPIVRSQLPSEPLNSGKPQIEKGF